MIGIVLVGHGTLAIAVLRSIENVLGHTVRSMVAVGAGADETLASLKSKIAAAVAEVEDGEGTLILTDMFGDTATNASIALACDARIQIVSGANLPMMVKAISARQEMPLEKLASFIVDYGREHILRVRPDDVEARHRTRR